MTPPDFRSPLRSLTDVPVERGRVGAMGLSSPSLHGRFRPYVYRGTGEDTMPGVSEEPRPPKPKRTWTHEQAIAARDRRVAKRKAEVAAAKRRSKRRKVSQKPPPPRMTEPEPEPWRPARKLPRPSPGWKPTTGDDLDSMLRELGDDE